MTTLSNEKGDFDVTNDYPELQQLLNNFTLAALKEQPKQLIKFASRYFNNLLKDELKRKLVEKSKEQDISVSEYSNSEDELDDDISDDSDYGDTMSDRKAKMMLMRISDAPRPTIVGEKFDPSELEDEKFGDDRAIYPKTFQQLNKISQILKTIFLFKSLDDEQMQKVILSMFYIEVSPGEIIIKENDPGDNFYIIDRGDFLAYNEANTIHEKYHNEGFFGELALMYNAPRQATVIAKSEGSLWAIDRISFRKLILKNAYNKRKMLEGFLQNVKIFKKLSDYDRSNLADALKTDVFNNNDVIIREGDIGNCMYFIEKGEVMVTHNKENNEVEELARLHSGDYFGDVALIAKIPRIATVRSVGTVRVAELDVDSYDRLMGPCIDEMRSNFYQYKPQLENLLSSKQMQELFPDLI